MTDDLRVHVDSEPQPGLLRPAIEAALADRPWPPGPESQVAAAVAAAVRASDAGGHGPVNAPPAAGAHAPGIRPPGGTTQGGAGR